MSELRHDPIQKQWVIVATQRGQRPTGFHVQVSEPSLEFCPLCPTNESKTPHEIFALREGFSAPDSPGWELRIVPNKYPALMIEGDLERAGVGLYDRMRGVGAHEIVVETPRHDRHLADQPVSHLTNILRAYRDRMKDLMGDARFLSVMVFRNQGEGAGATLAHPHAQVVALPILPKVMEIEITSARDHFRRTERCLFCDILSQEESGKVRMVVEGKRFSVFAPYASRSPYELFLMPRYHHADFSELTDQDTRDLATVLSETVRRLKACLDDPPYNLVVHSSPNLRARSVVAQEFPCVGDCYHWHIEIIPRLSRTAGFEWGTGFYINSTAPEEAAENLRSVKFGA